MRGWGSGDFARRCVALLFAACSLATGASAQAVTLERVAPVGAQRGTTVELELRGKALGDALELIFDRSGLVATDVVSSKPEVVTATLEVAPDAPLGAHTVRVRTRRGLSDPRIFHVGALPIVDEVEPNGEAAAAALLPLGVTVHGSVAGEDEDVFAFDTPSGTRVRAVVEALRVGSRDFDPLVEILDESGSVLQRGDDSALVLRDSIVEALASGERTYVRIRDAARRARSGSRYRLHVDAGPQPIAASRLAVSTRPAEHAPESRLLLGGDGLIGSATPRVRDLTARSGWAAAGAVSWWPDGSLAPLTLRASDIVAVEEIEPNDDRRQPMLLGALEGGSGLAVEGTLGRPNDADHFVVELEKGATVDIAVWARRLRSSVDATLSVRDPDGKAVYADDDSGLDPVERINAKKSGPYTIRVGEYLARGGSDCFYRLEVTSVTPGIGVRIPGQRKELAVPRGRRGYFRFSVERRDYDGSLALHVGELGDGLLVHGLDEALRSDAPLVLVEAQPNAPLGAVLARVEARGAGGVRADLREELVVVEGVNRSVIQGHVQSRLPIAVTEAAPFDVHVEAIHAPLVRSGKQEVLVRVSRDEGFTAPIAVGLVGLPPGVRTASQQRLEGDTLEARFTLDAASNAALGDGRVCAAASATVDGVTVSLASPFVALSVAPPVLALETKRALVEREGTAEMPLKLRRQEGAPEGTFEVAIVGLPHDVSSETLPLDPETEALAFPLSAGPKAPTGLHRGLTLEARIAVGDGVVRQVLPGIELRVQPKAAPPKGAAAVVEAQASRLDRLRAEHAARVEVERAEATPVEAAAPVEASGSKKSEAAETVEPPPANETSGLSAAVWRFIDQGSVPRARLASNPPEDGAESEDAPAEPDAVPSFLNDVVPILTASGCNAGACHGASRGQDGFHLSLFGYDAAGDHGRLLVERFARRIDLAFPEESLFLTKATGAVPHTGGALLEVGGEDHETLLRWIRAGAPNDVATAPRVVGLKLEPEAFVLAPEADSALRAIATYSDGTTRDVTRLALLRTSDATVATLERDGSVRTGAHGEALLTAAFATETVGAPVIVRRASLDAPWSDPAEGQLDESWIDVLVAEKQRAVGSLPAPLCSDEEFQRRVSLDLAGLPPSVSERQAFLDDTRPSSAKRRALVDELLARPEFIDQWCMRLAEMLRIRSTREISPKAAQAWFEWLQTQLQSGVGIDEVVRRQLTAKGENFDVPEASYFLVEREPHVMAENVSQALLGVRISCAQCHNHPFDRWTQDDYAGFVAFFSEVRSKRAEDPNERVVIDRRGRDFRHPTTNEVVAPKFLGGDAPDVGRRLRREVLAEWLVAPENPWFARNIANRVWASFMGRGVVDPVDDVRVTNPPASRALLDALSERLVASDFDLRDLAREIVMSRAYQRTSSAPPDSAEDWDRRNFAAFQVRRLRAETLSDAISVATGVVEDLPRLAPGVPATQLADGADANYFLRTFGRAERTTSCACEVSDAPSLSQALHLVNGSTVHAKVARGAVVRELIESGADDATAIEALFARALCRAPSDEERAELTALLTDAQDERRAALEDLFWALLTSNEFLFQR